jgi:hypothetical protein
MIKNRALTVMVARAIRHAVRGPEQPSIGDIVDAALDPIRVDCDDRRRHHKRWGSWQVGAGVAILLGTVAAVLLWHLDLNGWWVVQARGFAYLAIILGAVNLGKRRVYADLARRLVVVQTNPRSEDGEAQT